jgi:hypothetical protein
MAFIRPDLIQKVMEHLSKFSPPVLYIMGDGPRNEHEEELCEKSRNIALNPSWKCEVVPILNNHNEGVVASFIKGIDRMFSEHEFGIYLEDDVLLSKSFYNFSSDLLIKYRDNPSVGHINATNMAPHYKPKYEASYIFGNFITEWGFATWRRMWKSYDVNIRKWNSTNKKAMVSEACFNFRSKRSFKKMLDLHCNNPRPLAWGYQWQFNCLYNKALAITPSVNMSLNIGFERQDSTNTFGKNPIAHQLQDCQFPLSHPKEIVRDMQFDRTVLNALCPSDWSVLKGKVRNKLPKFLRI